MKKTWTGSAARLGAGLVGAGALTLGALAVAAGGSAGSSGPPRYVPEPGALPERFRATSPETAEQPALDSVDHPTAVEVFDADGRDLLVVSGSHDALESLLPPGTEAGPTVGDRRELAADGWHYLVAHRGDGPAIREVAMVHAPDSPRFPEPALAIVAAAQRPAPVATGDISALTNGTASNSITYTTPDGGDALLVQTFPSARLDPVLEHFAPKATPHAVGESPGYLLTAADATPVLATEGSGGELVLVAGTSTDLQVAELVTVARSAISQ